MAEHLLELIQAPTDEPLHLMGFTGEEYLSSPYYFSVQAQVADAQTFDVDTLINQPLSFRVNSGGMNRVYHGLVAAGTNNWLTKTDEPNVTLLLRPWLYFLNQRQDSRIFAVNKPQNIPDIIKAVFAKAGYADYRFELNRSYPRLNICVQYQETDFNFVSRLLEQAGIYYYFTHTDDKHTLVMSDAPYPTLNPSLEIPYIDSTHTRAHVTAWQSTVGFSPATLKAQGYDMTQPNTLVTASAKHESHTGDLPETFLQQCFHYPVQSNSLSTDELRDTLQRKLQGESLRVNFVTGSSNDVRLGAGNLFSLQGHPVASQNDDYYIAAIAHNVEIATAENNLPTYENTFRAFKTTESFVPQGRYRADTVTARDSILSNSLVPQLPVTTPIIRGVSLATVVGPRDTPIYTDQYGRIKVQFDWDNHSKGDENSFAWVRVKQALSSELFGLHFTPRVGQTVLVSFDQGDPNQPTVIGVMPSESNPPPFSPDKTPSQLGFQTRSLDPAATQQAISGHQLMFDDNPKNPNINLHAYKDLNIVTNNNHQLNVQGKTTTTVQNGNYVQQVGGKLIINANKAVHLVNGNSRISITPSDIILEADKIVMGNNPVQTVTSTISVPGINAPLPDTKSTNDGQLNATSNQKNMYPSAEISITNLIHELPPRVIQLNPMSTYVLKALSTLSGSLSVKNKNSVNPLTFDKNGFKIEAHDEVAKIFSQLNIVNPGAIMDSSPKIEISNNYGDYNFSLVANALSENVQVYTASLSKSLDIQDEAWIISGDITITMDVSLTKNHSPGSALPVLLHDLEYGAVELKTALSTITPTPYELEQIGKDLAIVILIVIMVAALPVGA